MHIRTYKKVAANQGGFTLIELLVVIGILAILLAITLIALNPTQHFQGARNAQRSSDVTAILDGIYEYEAKNTGNLPPVLQSLDTNVHELSNNTSTYSTGNTPDGNPLHVQDPVDLCSAVIPTYIADLPLDPDSSLSNKSGATTCQIGGTYDTGYTIVKSASGRFTIAAPGAENGSNISVTR